MQYLYPQGKRLALTFSYDDGQIFDRRLIQIFREYGMKGTFHLNSGKLGAENFRGGFVARDEIKTLYEGHEVACHGVEHRNVGLLTRQQLLRELEDDRRTLEGLTGSMVHGLSYAYGVYSQEAEDVARCVGLKYSRTTNSTHSFFLPTNFLEWNPTCHHGDPMLMELGQRFLDSPTYRELPLMYVWGHSYEFDGNRNWGLMEEFCKFMSGRDDVWYCTNLEICDYATAMQRLEFSADGKRAYNPSAISIWMQQDEKILECKPGETISF